MQTIESIRKTLTQLDLSEESQTSHTAHVQFGTGSKATATSFPDSLSSAVRWSCSPACERDDMFFGIHVKSSFFLFYKIRN